MYASYQVVPRVEMVSNGIFFAVAYDDDVPMSELICDGTTPSFDHSEAMVKAEMQALQVRSRLDEVAMHVDVRLTAIRSMLQRIASTPTTNYTPSPLDR